MNYEPGWDMILEEQPGSVLEPSDEDRKRLFRKGQDVDVLNVEGGRSAYAESGVLSSTGARECLAIGVVHKEGEAGAMYHLVAESMDVEEVSDALIEISMDIQTFSDIEDTMWNVVGGYRGDPEYKASKSPELEDSDIAMARRGRVEGYLEEIDPLDYDVQWIDQPDEIMTLYIDIDRPSAIAVDEVSQPGNEEERAHNPDYLWR